MTNENLRPVSKHERTGKRGKELTCPHCGDKWLAGHLHWQAFACNKCKKDVDKFLWLCKED